MSDLSNALCALVAVWLLVACSPQPVVSCNADGCISSFVEVTP